MGYKNVPAVFVLALLVLAILPAVSAQEEKTVCAVYFTGVGCPHCAKTDPVVLEQASKDHPSFVVIEYEIYQQRENAPLLYAYDAVYGSGLGVPLIIFSKEESIVGDIPILRNLDIEGIGANSCPLADGSSVDFSELDITSLPGKPKIWTNERILMASEGGGEKDLLKALLTAEDLSSAVEGFDYSVVEPVPVPLSGKNVNFENAIKINGWIFQWNGEAIRTSRCPSCPKPGNWSECINGTRSRTNYKCSEETNFECVSYTEVEECAVEEVEETGNRLTLAKILSLAAVDAINPCAIAVLTLMLIAILTYNPKKKRNVLLAGLAFTTSVFIMYLFYGLVIIRFFQLVQALTSIRLWLYTILGVAAVILGILNIKDFFRYKPGGVCTEMPLKIRPTVQKIISGITSPKGAFAVGIFVTIFLLPCTIGPYVIAGGILSALELFATIPWLLFYNFIFVLPMLVITAGVYKGFAKVEDVSGWKEKNIRHLHLIAGIIMMGLGIAMVMGWI